jgi:hypothetical protein
VLECLSDTTSKFPLIMCVSISQAREQGLRWSRAMQLHPMIMQSLEKILF